MRIIHGYTPVCVSLDRMETVQFVEALNMFFNLDGKLIDNDADLLGALTESNIIEPLKQGRSESKWPTLVLKPTTRNGFVRNEPTLTFDLANPETWTAVTDQLKAMHTCLGDEPAPVSRRPQHGSKATATIERLQAYRLVTQIYEGLMKTNAKAVSNTRGDGHIVE